MEATQTRTTDPPRGMRDAGPQWIDATSPAAHVHRAERLAVLARHPEARALAGARAATAAAVPLILALHWAMAWLVSGTNLLVVFVAAFFYGQLVLHAAGALVHETAHRLVFHRAWPKRAFDLALELVLASFGRQLTYQHEHISSHHPYQGDYARDYEHEDLCAFLARRELRARDPRRQRLLTGLTLLLHLAPLGFLVSDRVMPWLYAKATGRRTKDVARDIGATRPGRGEKAAFCAVSIVANVVLFLAFGFWGWLYHVWALSLFLGKWGITNLGQSLSEHPGDDELHPTRSTYWWGNAILFNTGYHHEHHAFPNVAWINLPRLKALAPDVFSVASPRSYFGMWWDHVRADFSPSRRSPEADAPRVERCEGTVRA